MIVKIPKDIDATEAKIFNGLSLKKAATFALAAGVVIMGQFMLHLPMLVTAACAGLVLFFGIFERQGMNAPIIVLRVGQSFVRKRKYTREVISTCVIKSAKQVKKDAAAWNKWLRREKRRNPEIVAIKSVRCTKNKKTRK